MNDFDGLLTTEFGFKPQGKSAPMAASKPPSNTSSLNFDFGSRSARAPNSVAVNDSVNSSFDDLFGSTDFRSKSVNLPAHDKPLYDDDVFDGVPGLRSSAKASYDDVFAPAAFDDLLGQLGKSTKSEKKEEKGVSDFDDLIPGFGSSKANTDRTIPDIDLSSEPSVNTSKTASGVTDDPFKVFESTSVPLDSSSDYVADPLEEISKFTGSRSTRNDSSSNSNGEVYDDIDPFSGLGNSVPAYSAERNSRKGSSSPTPRSNTSSSWTRDKESNDKSSVRSPERQTQNKIPLLRCPSCFINQNLLKELAIPSQLVLIKLLCTQFQSWHPMARQLLDKLNEQGKVKGSI